MATQVRSEISLSNYLQWTIRRSVPVILAILTVTLFFAYQIRNLSFKTSVYDLEIEDLPETVRYGEFKKLFGSDEIIRVVAKTDGVFEPDTFQKIEQLAAEAAQIEGVRRVISLPGIKQAVDLGGNWPMEKFNAVVSNVELFRKNLFSEDGKSTALTLVLKNDADPDRVIQGVETLIDQAEKELALYQVGMPLVSRTLVQFTERDFFRLPPITFLLIALILFFLFRKLQFLFIPLVCVGLALIWTFGFMALLGIALSMLTMIVPVFLIAVGTAYCFHIVTEYLVCIRKADTPKQAALETFSSISFPTFLAVLTTIIGLGSLMVNRIPTIREFALFSCFGMFSLLVIVLTFLPAVLARIPLPKGKQRKKIGATHLFDNFIQKIIHLNLYKQKVTLPILGGLALICLAGVLQIRVETNPVGYFKEDTPVKQHFYDIYQDLSGSFPINVVMAGKDDYHFEDPRHISDISKLQEYLETLPGVDKTMSFADYLMLVNYALNGFDPQYYALPQEGFEVRMAINNYPTMLGEDMFTRFMNQNLSRTNIVLLTHIASSDQFLETREKILAHVERQFSNDLSWDVTGFGIVISASSDQLTKGQIKSLSLTLVLVFGIMFLLFLSARVGLIAIVPNLFPITVNFGVMGWLGIELSMVTALIASVAIGLAVDDTIHYMVRYNREFKKDLNDERSIRETLQHVGRPIIFTTITICIGFSILMFSSFKPTAVFGIMMVITMLSALVGDLILLPSLMQHVELVTLWDLVRLKMGLEPSKGIPLFNNMSKTEVHYLIMAGSLKYVDAGQVLFHKGEPSDSMYTIVSGAMDVIDPLPGAETSDAYSSQRVVNHLQTGDVLGEMGLLRSAPRSATVVAAKPVELLQINWKMIQRLQWLYPPVAYKFMHNLMIIICDRLEKLTNCLADAMTCDDSTGLCNYETFLRCVQNEIQRARRYVTPLSLCLLDVDFESDHPALDTWQKENVLRDVTDFLTHNVRSCDILGRCDLNRFGMLVPQTPVDKARDICDRLALLMQNHQKETNGIPLNITWGISSVQADRAETAMDLFARVLEDLNLKTQIKSQ